MRKLRSILTKIPLFPRVVSLHVVLWSVALLGFYMWGPKSDTTYASTTLPLTAYTTTHIAENIISGEPDNIRVDRLNINLPIKNGTYDSKTATWTLSSDAAYFATMTTLPNNQHGNTFIYGHNTRQVFEPLSGLVPGDIITITTTNGHVFSYSYSHDSIIPPDLTSVLYSNPKTPQLTIMTCEGILSQTRRLMYFDLQGAQ